MKKAIKKTIAGLFLTGFLGFTALSIIILHPQGLFAYEMTYENFTVYANEPINPGIQNLLDEANALVKNCELNDLDYRYDIFLSHNTFFNKIDNLILGSWPAARATDNNIVVKVEIDVAKNWAFTEKSKINLAYLFAHEMVHCLQPHKYGKLSFNPLNHPPMWKLEGYPEYVARQNILSAENYDLRREIARFLQLEKTAEYGWIQVEKTHFLPVIYYKGRLMMEYLMDVKKLSYDQILDESIEEHQVYEEMLNWQRSSQ